MNIKISSTLALVIASALNSNAHASLASNAVLLFNDAVTDCSGYYCSSSYNTVTSGSYFSIDFDGDGKFSTTERTGMRREDGVIINTAQPAHSTYPGDPFSTTFGTIDKPFSFLSADGVHQTTSPVYILSDNGSGLVMLDFSGWGVTWNGIPDIPLGGDISRGETGIANLICGNDCGLGDTFTLDYTAHVPVNHLSGFGGVYYGVHLEGTIGSVPVPAAAWLFGSGLIGLAGIARKHKAA